MSTDSAKAKQSVPFAREQVAELQRLLEQLTARDQSADCRALVDELRFVAEALAQSIEDVVCECGTTMSQLDPT